MKINALLFLSFIAMISFVSCSKDTATQEDPNDTLVVKKYLLKVESLFVNSDPMEENTNEVTTYKYDADNRVILKIQKAIYGGVDVDNYDSIVYSYTGANPYPSKKEKFDKLYVGSLPSVSLYTYDSQNRLIRDSVVGVSAATYNYAGNKLTIVNSIKFGDDHYTVTDEMTKDATGNNFTKIDETFDGEKSTANLTFNTAIFNPYFYSDPTTFSTFDNIDDIGLMVNLFGKNGLTKISTPQNVINIQYENITDKWPGKVTIQ